MWGAIIGDEVCLTKIMRLNFGVVARAADNPVVPLVARSINQ